MKRPELKVPEKLAELKPPDFLANLFYDLRDRRLLPLIALVVVAIAAVPLLLGNEAEPVPLPQPPAGGGEATARSADASLVVVEANPGLRDYRKRLEGRTPTDPFGHGSG
ncbi:MAG: hypothetical protein WA687_00455, partial [Solirubrobacterales bacterium]